jgi:hypothetical protein
MHKAMGMLLIMTTLCLSSMAEESALERAQKNGETAQEALVRSRAVLRAYLQRRDPVTGLLPRKGGVDTWYVRDSAADLYPFLVMAAYYTDRPAFEGAMHEILRAEIQWSTRVGRLSDNVLAGGGFEHPEIDMERIIFGSGEYAKDGLLPLAELLGRTPWFERLTGIADDLLAHAPYKGPFGSLPSLSSEVNGELLQVFTRLAYLSKDPRYVDQAMAIARFYFEEVLPKSNGLPVQIWDLKAGKPDRPYFNFADHGNEIVGGLSEFVLYLKLNDHPRYPAMAASLTELVDLLLEIGLNDDGVWVSKVGWADHAVTDARHAHCWGYLFNAVYTTHLITGEERFLDAVKHALRAVTEKATYLDDPDGSERNYGSNAYSDALESAIVFLNRMPDAAQFRVLDECVTRFLDRQRDDGIIEDWYGDGNYVRTALMYALMKSQGTWVEEWREDLRLGAVADDDGLVLVLESEQAWAGRLRFDVPRHRLTFNMPLNYPRLNEFPEWFVVDQDGLYDVQIDGEKTVRVGGELARGIEVKTSAGKPLHIRVTPAPGPPYGTLVKP